LKVIEITGSACWQPCHSYDDSKAVPSLSDEAIQGFHAKTSMDDQDNQETGEDAFYDAPQETDEFCWCSSGSFSAKAMKATSEEDDLHYFHLSHDISNKARFGKAFHLPVDYDSFLTPQDENHVFTRDASVNDALQEMTMEEIIRHIPSKTTFDTHAHALQAAHQF
jgi:hypothetical protein